MHLKTWGGLALGSRLRALSEALYEAGDEVYRERGLGFSARWFPVLRLLYDRGPLPVTEVAREIGQTHSAVSQLAAKLGRDGWLGLRGDPADGRRSLLALTPKAARELRRAEPTWRAVADEIEGDLGACVHDLLAAVAALEARLAERPLAPRVVARARRYDLGPVRVVPFRRSLRGAFYRLNAAWLREHFGGLEPIDERVLSEPEREIIRPGGAVLFALAGGEAVGTCALKAEGAGVYELTKMAVEGRFRGLGAGRALLAGALAEFERRGGHTLYLESSRKLAPALRLYESAGFELQPGTKPGSPYRRADVYMVYRGPGGAAAARGGGRGGDGRATAAGRAGDGGVRGGGAPANERGGGGGARAGRSPADGRGGGGGARAGARARGGEGGGPAPRAVAATGAGRGGAAKARSKRGEAAAVVEGAGRRGGAAGRPRRA